METFPPSVVRPLPVTLTEAFSTRITSLSGGKEFREKLWGSARRTVSIPHDMIVKSEATTLRNFFRQRYGAYEAFYFVWHEARDLVAEYVGRGDGSTVLFDFPSIETVNDASLKVYVNGTETAVTLIPTGGAVFDRIMFGAAPAEGAYISADFTGKLVMKLRFKADDLAEEQFLAVAYSIGIELYEVGW